LVIRRSVLVGALALLGCVDETDICVGHDYELIILDVPQDIDEMTFHLEFESRTIEATCARGADDPCGVLTDEWTAEMGFATDPDRAWMELDDHERKTSHVPHEIRVVLSSPTEPNFAADRTFNPDIEYNPWDCESAQDIWTLD
jgi:hypothetical protein